MPHHISQRLIIRVNRYVNKDNGENPTPLTIGLAITLESYDVQALCSNQLYGNASNYCQSDKGEAK